MTDAEAGPSSPPVFKRRGKPSAFCRPARVRTSLSPPPTHSSSLPQDDDNQEEEAGVSVQDLIALRTLSRKPTGIELEKLNRGQRSRKERKSRPNPEQSEQGGGGGGESDEESAATAGEGRRLVRKNNFQGETGTVDVDKHMMAYIEAEMSKRRSGGGTTSEEVEKAMARADPHDQLYEVAEKYKALQRSIKPEQTQDEREGNVALSSAMLTSIPEVDLGIDSRMRNIEDTERAKRALYEQGKQGRGREEGDAAYANARFMQARPRQGNSDREYQQRKDGEQQRKQLATDQLVMDRFKKRQRTFR